MQLKMVIGMLMVQLKFQKFSVEAIVDVLMDYFQIILIQHVYHLVDNNNIQKQQLMLAKIVILPVKHAMDLHLHNVLHVGDQMY